MLAFHDLKKAKEITDYRGSVFSMFSIVPKPADTHP